MMPSRQTSPAAAPSVNADGEAVWRALADPTRRAILDLLRVGPLTAGGLSERFTMTRFGVRKHIAVLCEAGLVLIEQRGRERLHRLNPVPIRELYQRWIRPFEEAAADHLLDIRQRAEARVRKAHR